MAINYERINNGAGWDTRTSTGPTNFNHMEQGIKEACDAIDVDCLQVEETTPIGEYKGTHVDYATRAKNTESGKDVDNELNDIKATLAQTQRLIDEDKWKAGDVWDLNSSGAFAGVVSGTNAYITIPSPKIIPSGVNVSLSGFVLQSSPNLYTLNGVKSDLNVDQISKLSDQREIRFRISGLSGVTPSTPCTYWGGFKITFS